MAVSAPTLIQTYTTAAGALSHGPTAIGSTVPAGTFVYVAMLSSSRGATLGISDSQGNTWTPLSGGPFLSLNTGAATANHLFYAVLKTGGWGPSDTITTTTSVTGSMLWICSSLAGVDVNNPIDVAASASTPGTTNTAWAAPTVSPSLGSLVLGFGSLGTAATTIGSLSSGYVQDQRVVTTSTNLRALVTLYRLTAATGATIPSGTLSASQPWEAVSVSFAPSARQSTAAVPATATVTAAGVVGRVSGAVVGSPSASPSVAGYGLTPYGGAATGRITATITAAGSVSAGLSTGATVAATDAVTTAGAVGRVSGATLTATATLTTAATVGATTSATVSATATITGDGIVGRASGATVAATATITTAGAVVAGLSTGAAVTETATITTAGLVGKATDAVIAAIDTVTAAGSVAVVGSATVAATDTITSAARVGKASGAAIAAAAGIVAAGSVGLRAGATVSATVTITGSGSAATVGVTVKWWDGTTEQTATLLGWWDGATIQPATLLGWWDGATIQTLA